MSVEKLAKETFERLTTGFEKLPTDLSDQIQVHGKENFVTQLVGYFPNMYVQNFLVSHREIWESFTIDNWRKILTGLQDNDLGLYTIISFLSKYLIIDSLEVYKNMSGVNEQIRTNVLEYFSERPGLLKLHKFELKNLKANNINWVDIEPEDDNIIRLED